MATTFPAHRRAHIDNPFVTEDTPGHLAAAASRQDCADPSRPQRPGHREPGSRRFRGERRRPGHLHRMARSGWPSGPHRRPRAILTRGKYRSARCGRSHPRWFDGITVAGQRIISSRSARRADNERCRPGSRCSPADLPNAADDLDLQLGGSRTGLIRITHCGAPPWGDQGPRPAVRRWRGPLPGTSPRRCGSITVYAAGHIATCRPPGRRPARVAPSRTPH